MRNSILLFQKAPFRCINFILISIGLSAFLNGCSPTPTISSTSSMDSLAQLEQKEQTYITATTESLDEYFFVEGTVTYADSEDLAFYIDQLKLKTLYVSKNDQVLQGQLLAELDTTELLTHIALRQIDLQKVQLQYDTTKINPNLSDSDRDVLLSSLALDIQSIQLDIDHTNDQIKKAYLYAPFDGLITSIKNIQQGTIIHAYDGVLTLWKGNSLMIESKDLNPSTSSEPIHLANIVAGKDVTIYHGNKDKKVVLPGVITSIINLDPGVIDNPDRILSINPSFKLYIKPSTEVIDQLQLDQTVLLKIKINRLENVIVIPDALIKGYGQDHMIKVIKGDKIINRMITIGYKDIESGMVVIKSGLREGEHICDN